MKPTALLTLLALFSTAPLPATADDDVFRSEIAEIEVAKPAGWVYQNLETVARYRADVQLKDEELKEAIQNLATAPLVIATKHPEPYDSLNPSFQLIVRPVGELVDVTVREVLELVVPRIGAGFENFELVADVSDFDLDGLPAARFTAQYSIRSPDGREFTSRATMVAVRRGSFLYQMSFSGPPEGPDALGTEIETVLASFRFLGAVDD